MVVATTSLVSALVIAIGGPGVEVRQVIPPGGDPVAYRPPANVTGLLDGSDVTIGHGLGIEAGLAPFLAVAAQHGPVVGVADAIPADRLLGPGPDGVTPTPAVWLDPGLWSLAAERVAVALGDADPEMAAAYRERADAIRADLADVGTYLASTFATVPDDRRSVATLDHGAAYLLAPHGITVTGMPLPAAGPWLSSDEVTALADAMAAAGVGVVLVPASLPASARAALAGSFDQRDMDVTVLPLALGTLGRPGTLEADYGATLRGLAEAVITALVVENA